MFTTPTFQVYMGDKYNNTADQDLITSCGYCFMLIIVTAFFSFVLENREARRITLAALIIEIISLVLSTFVIVFGKAYYWEGFFQSLFLDLMYMSLLWMPAYVQVTKMIP